MTEASEQSKKNKPSPGNSCPMSRRDFLTRGAVALTGMAALAGALSPLKDLDSEDLPSIEKFLQKHYKEMSLEDKQRVLRRIALEIKNRFKVEARLSDPQPLDGVEYVYALNLSRCIGCRKCVHACVKENNCSRSPQIEYIRVLQMKKGSIDLETSKHHYHPPQVPEQNSYYMPVQCHQCSNPPCVKACPVKATWQEADGITVIDYDWCIGCRYCEAACPYWARRFNFAGPEIDAEQLNPDVALLSNRPRKKGVMEKCTFCLQRTRQGKFPACLEVCPTGSRKFGNVLDAKSEVSYILKNKRIFILKEEVGTLPRFFYYFDERGSRYHEDIAPLKPEEES